MTLSERHPAFPVTDTKFDLYDSLAFVLFFVSSVKLCHSFGRAVKLCSWSFSRTPEFSWIDTMLFSKELVKVAFVGKAKFINDLGNTHGAMQEPVFHQFYFVVGNIILEGFACMLFKIAAEVRNGDAEFPAQA